MNNMDYRLYVEEIPSNLTANNEIYPFEYDSVEPTESIYNGDDYMKYLKSTIHPSCSPIPIKVPSREPEASINTSTHTIVSYRVYYTNDAIIYGVIISAGFVFVFIVIVYFYKWFDKNRKKIGKIKSPKNRITGTKYNGGYTRTPENTIYNSDF